jgi:hypothetical protein
MIDSALDAPTLDAPTDLLEPIDPSAQLAIIRAQAGEPLSATELGAILRIGPAHFANLRKAGQFDQFLLKPAIGKRAVYSGVKVYRYLCGDPVYEPVFAGKRRR